MRRGSARVLNSVLLFALPLVGVGCEDGQRRVLSGDAGADASDAGPEAGSACEGRAEAAIGAAGGELRFCGARLIVPADVLTETVTFAIEPAEVPAPAPPDVLAGQAFRFTPDGAPLPGEVEIELPHDGGEGARVGLQRLVGNQLQGFEPCRVEADVIAQSVDTLGVFVAVRDPNSYPDGPSGLGKGDITYTIDDVEYTGAVDPEGTVAGYVIDEAPTADTKSITAVLRAAAGETFSQVDLRFAVDAGGDISVVQIAWTDLETMESANWVSAVHDPEDVSGSLSFEDGELIGALTATLYAGDVQRAFAGEFQLKAEKYRFPGELSCGFPEG